MILIKMLQVMFTYVENILMCLFKSAEIMSNWILTYIILVLLFAALIFSILRREYLRHRQCWLSVRIDNSIKELRRIRHIDIYYEKITGWFSQFYYPTWARFLFLIVMLSLFLALTDGMCWVAWEDSAEFYRSLVPVQIGIVALIFPIMI